MKVFISWSGERSKLIAESLYQWLPNVLQAVEPYFSPDDVAKGTRWSTEIAKELDASNFGLMVVTPENQHAPWLMFEAGSLGKSIDKSKVCPLLFGEMQPAQVTGPLVQFQSAIFSKKEIERVVKAMNTELGDSGLPPTNLAKVFDKWWPDLEGEVSKALENSRTHKAHKRDPQDMLEEILGLLRQGVDRESKSDDPLRYLKVLIVLKDILKHSSLVVSAGQMKAFDMTLTQVRQPDNPSFNQTMYDLFELLFMAYSSQDKVNKINLAKNVLGGKQTKK